MKMVVYSPLVKRKMKALKIWLIDHHGESVAEEVLTGIIKDADVLAEFEKSGTSIAEIYHIDTEYWYIFTHQHYLVYRIEPQSVIVVQMFHEKEDFMKTLFGISGRTQESIDYWGE